jgi:hypothetical protein
VSVIRVLNRAGDVTRRYHLTDDWPDERGSGPDRLYTVRLGRKSNPVYHCGVLPFFELEPDELNDPEPLAAAQRSLVAYLRERGWGDWLRQHRIPVDGSLPEQRRRYARLVTVPHARCRDGRCLEREHNPDVESCS